MRTVEYSGELIAQTSISHSTRSMGNIQTFRSETFITPEGKKVSGVPVVSGNTIRGHLRRIAARMTQDVIAPDGGKLPFRQVNAFRSGGALKSGMLVTGEQQAILRQSIPMLGVFGVSAGSRIMSGRLLVDKAIPITKETAFLTQDDPASLLSFHEHSQRETYTKTADVLTGEGASVTDMSEEIELPSGSGDMIYEWETLVAGTRFSHRIVLEDGTPEEVSFFEDMMGRWAKEARMGSGTKRGLGKLRTDYERTVTDPLGNASSLEETPGWVNHMQDNMEQIKEILKWL